MKEIELRTSPPHLNEIGIAASIRFGISLCRRLSFRPHFIIRLAFPAPVPKRTAHISHLISSICLILALRLCAEDSNVRPINPPSTHTHHLLMPWASSFKDAGCFSIMGRKTTTGLSSPLHSPLSPTTC